MLRGISIFDVTVVWLFYQLTVSSVKATMLYHPRMAAALNRTWSNGTGLWTSFEDEDPPEPPDVGVGAAAASVLDPEDFKVIDEVLGEGDQFRPGLFFLHSGIRKVQGQDIQPF